jgi:glycosyltransferase involved in cell wall biosynthesis
MPELITDSEDGFLVGKEDHSALARRLEYVSSLSKEDKIKLSKTAHEKSKVFSIDRFVRDLDGLVSELAGE